MLSRRHLLFAAGALPAAAQDPRPAPAPQPVKAPVDAILKVDPRATPELPPHPPRPAAEATGPLAGQQWKISYFFDEAARTFLVGDFCCPAPDVVLAVGVLRGERGQGPENRGVVSRDGGATWSTLRLPRTPNSVFALDAANVWLVANGRLYYTSDLGGKWTRLRLPRKMVQVSFITPQSGFAYGFGKTFHRTADGGRTWTPVAESTQLPLTDERTLFRAMAFTDGRVGLMAGNSRRPEDDDRFLPDWMTPEQAMGRRRRPATTAVMTTTDGGATWRGGVTSAFGDVERLRASGGRGAALFSYGEGFVWPSEVFRMDLATGKSEPLFRRKGFRITDVALHAGTGYVLAAIEPFGRLPGAGLPGRLRMLYSPDGRAWFQMPVDYRAQGPHALLAGAGGRLFVAVSNGMILRLER